MSMILLVLAFLFFIFLLYLGHGFRAWTLAAVTVLAAWTLWGIEQQNVFFAVAAGVALAAALFGIVPLRRAVISGPIMKLIGPMLPKMGETERVALDAGTVWWDGDLFSGAPDWKKLLAFEPRPLSEEERAFLDGPVEDLCAMMDDWQITKRRDLSPEVWAYLKEKHFLGMIIPKEYGGLGFSAIAHSAVVTKLASRSVTAAVTVMVPNSLGPAELLLHYGTEEQKNHYLPRLASGEDIPCFALTEPGAGSDAASTQSNGVVCRGSHDGEEVLGLRLNWNKRYITLAPVATVVGLAVRLFDPEGLLGGEKDLGITCVLVPRDLPGIEIGNRHDPLNIPFQNGPTRGTDVFVPLESIIGGRDGAGQGWRMLMESLAAGRSISLPSLSVGAVELSARAAGAYATVREQFGLPIGRFEGVEEALARIAGHAYLLDAARILTCGAVDAGEKPAVVSAIAKAYMTETMRGTVNDAMDILAGAAICRGPRNIIADAYTSVPISITVEGANILTRSLIVYGQGAIRCHPFVHDEMEAIAKQDKALFDRAFFGHVNFVFTNAVRALLLGLSGGKLDSSPVSGPSARYFQAFTRFSAAFSLISDAALATLGGELKRREKLSGRLADALAWLYLGSATLKRFHDAGRAGDERPYMEWCCQLALHNIEEALRGVLENLPNRPAAWLLRLLVFPLGPRHRPPSDALGAKIAKGLLDGNEMRERLAGDIYIPPETEDGLGKLEAALAKTVAAATDKAKIRDALRAGLLSKAPEDALIEAAEKAGVIDADGAERLNKAHEARTDVIQVDDFDEETYAEG